MWALQRSSRPGAGFQYVANDVQWSPNEFLPGADGSNARSYDAGQGVNVIGTGGSAGGRVSGKGPFIIPKSQNPGGAPSPAIPTPNVTSGSRQPHLSTLPRGHSHEGHQNQLVL